MNLFRRKINQHDLIAYHLRELSPRREQAVRRALQADLSLAAESEAIAHTLGLFPPHESSIKLDSATLDSHWLKLRPSLTPYPVQETQPNIDRRPLFAGIGIAALLATTLFVALDRRPVAMPASPATTSSHPSTPPPTPNPINPP
jgi:hypothetical protein